ncbi:hypothetical protein [Pseudooceanicola algae]|nr:hypothetical protein [Pseudooceanicola algae]
MSLQDQIAINAAMALVLTVVADPAREKMHLAILREAASQMVDGRPRFEPFLDAARAMVGAAQVRPGGSGADWTRATWQMKDALRAIVEWRLGEAQEKADARRAVAA